MIKSCPTIGIVDDEPLVCRALSRLITSAGFNVITYGSAQAFLDDKPTSEPDLLVLDMRMPGMNGLDLQNHLAATGRTIPIVFITAHENELAKATAIASGAVAFFQKPLDQKDLLGAIHKALNLKNT
jgi:two-component system response regulator FixJ